MSFIVFRGNRNEWIIDFKNRIVKRVHPNGDYRICPISVKRGNLPSFQYAGCHSNPFFREDGVGCSNFKIGLPICFPPGWVALLDCE